MRTEVGYTGGTTLDPTYTDLGDHTESIQLEYDPEVVDYDDLLQIYWANITGSIPSCTQYAPIIFWHTEAQRDEAIASWEDMGQPTVSIRPVETFYGAEEYHQKYNLKRYDVVYRDFERMYSDHEDIVDSTAAARCNGILAGDGYWEQLEDELDSYGLSDAAMAELERHLR